MKKVYAWLLLGSFVLTCYGQCICVDSLNLAINPGFESGNTGFVSTLNYGANCTPGYYFIGTSMQSKCYLWPASFVDHTSGTGNFMLVDGNDTYAPEVIWSQQLQVSANATYLFSFWARNLYTQQPFRLGWSINGSVVDSTAFIAAGGWNRYYLLWTAPASAPVTFGIVQLTAGAYRDLGIDDMFLGTCRGLMSGSSLPSLPVSGIRVSPNPSTGEMQVSGEAHYRRATVYSLAGERILAKDIEENKLYLDLPSGIYIVQIENEEERITEKIVIE